MPAPPSQPPSSAAPVEARRPRKGDVVDCVIERMDARGRGIATLAGVDQAGEDWRATVAVRAGTPGATVRVRLLRGKGRRRFQGALLEVLDEGPDAVPARCPHAGVCGGCVSRASPTRGTTEKHVSSSMRSRRPSTARCRQGWRSRRWRGAATVGLPQQDGLHSERGATCCRTSWRASTLPSASACTRRSSRRSSTSSTATSPSRARASCAGARAGA